MKDFIILDDDGQLAPSGGGPHDKRWATRNAPDARSMVEAARVQLLYEQREAFLAPQSEDEENLK